MKNRMKNGLLACCGLAASIPAAGQAAEPQRPNVLLISVDDLNDWIAPLRGHPNAITPNIDRLAARSVVFRNACCQAPLSGPSRTSLLSGLYPSTTGVYGHILDKDLRKVPALRDNGFLPDYFAAHGYSTAGAGKVFHSGGGAGAFQEFGGTFGMYGPRPEKRFRYDPQWFGKTGRTQTDWGAFPERDEEMPDHKTVDWVVAKLNEKHDAPFFLAAGLVRPHVPWYLPGAWFERFPFDRATYPPHNPNDYDDIPEMARRVTELSTMMPDFDWVLEKGRWKEMIHAYLTCVMFMDHQVGRLLDALDASPYRDNTVIVFYGDNGYEMGEKGRFAKMALWRTSIHVPLILAGPGVEGGKTSEANVGLIDIYPTLTEVCGLPANPKNEGASLMPLLKDPARKWDRAARTFYGRKNQSLVWENFHYIRYDDGSEELYDWARDREEWYNLADDPAFGEVKANLRGMLIENRAATVPESFNPTNLYFTGGEDR